jgi:hypothetical protein
MVVEVTGRKKYVCFLGHFEGILAKAGRGDRLLPGHCELKLPRWLFSQGFTSGICGNNVDSDCGPICLPFTWCD